MNLTIMGSEILRRGLITMSLIFDFFLPISVQCCVSYRNQSLYLECKSYDWFPYDMQYCAEMG